MTIETKYNRGDRVIFTAPNKRKPATGEIWSVRVYAGQNYATGKDYVEVEYGIITLDSQNRASSGVVKEENIIGRA